MLIGNIPDTQRFPREQPWIPGLAEIGRISVLRTQGALACDESIGAGFLRKVRHNDFINWRYPKFVLVTVLQGTGLYMDSKGYEYPLSAGSTFMRIPGLEHSNYVDEKSGYLECYLSLGPILYRALCGMGILNSSSPVNAVNLQENPDLLNRIWHLGWRLTYDPDEEYADCAAELISVLGEYRKLSGQPDRGERYHHLVELACHQLGSDFQNRFSLQEFCRNHSVGYENFRKLFRARTGISPLDYRLRQRMETAVVLLRETTYSIREIAEQLGYCSVNDFSAQFHRKTGVSPSVFRKNH